MRKKALSNQQLQALEFMRLEQEKGESVAMPPESAKRRMRERLDGRSVDAIRAEASVFSGVRWPAEWERRAA
jgi:hypothetical protein